MKLRRTLFTAGVFALLAMIYVPTPHQGYRLIFSQRDTSIAFFQLLANVVFATLLGAIIATIIPKIATGVRLLPTWVWRGTGGIASIALFIAGAIEWWNLMEAAQRDERYANELLRQQHNAFDQGEAEIYFRDAARNWRFALRFNEAARVDKRIKELQDWLRDPVVQAPARVPQAAEHGPWEDYAAQGQPASTPQKYISTDPNFGLTPIPRARAVLSPSPR